MFGCLRRLGCLALLLVALLAAWYWYSRRSEPAIPPGAAGRVMWEAVTPAGAERGRLALEALSARGQPSVIISAGDLASYIFFALENRLPASTRDLQAAVIDDQLAVRGVVPFRDLGGSRILGPLASLIGDNDTLFIRGRLSVVERQLGEYRVTEVRWQQFRAPPGVVPRVLRQIDRGNRPPEVAPDALAVPLPAYVGDIRTGGGVITLYRSSR